MAQTLNSDLPPAYSTLLASSENKPYSPPEVVIPNFDVDSTALIGAEFEDRNARIGFIQKVLSIVLMQIITVAVIITEVGMNWTLVRSIRDNQNNLMMISSVTYLGTLILMTFYNEARKKAPHMFLVAHALSFAFVIVSFFTRDSLEQFLTGWICYVLAVLALLIYSIFCFNTNVEFRVRTGIIITTALLVVLYILTCPLVTMYMSYWTTFGFNVLVLLECSSLLYRLHVMTGKNYRYPITPEDYVTGAVNLHIDYGFVIVRFVREKVFYCQN